MTNYRRKISKALAVLLSLIMALSSFAAYAESDTEIINLDVKSGDDIAEKFNKAADKARYSDGSKMYKIIVPKGKYSVSTQIRLYSNTTVDFTGSVIEHTTNDYFMLRLGRKGADWDNYNGGKGRPEYSGFSNIHIIGGTFDGCGKQAELMRFGHSKNISITGAHFRNVKNTHFVEIGACSGVEVTNCTFSDFAGDYNYSRNSEALQFDALADSHFSGYNPNQDETPCENVRVENCVFKNLQRGLGTHSGVVNTYFDNMVYKNNYFENITGYAIAATNYRNSTISGNTVKNSGSGIIFRTTDISHTNVYASKYRNSYSSKYTKLNSKICWNTVYVTSGYKVKYRNNAYGIQVLGEKLSKKVGNMPAGDYRCAGVTVNNNNITMYCTGFGIYVKGAMENSIFNNYISLMMAQKGTYSTGVGIRLKASGYNYVGTNTVNNITKRGYDKGLCGIILYYGSGSNTIYKNKILRAKLDGIHIDTSSNKNKISYNSIGKSGRCGIAIFKCKKIYMLGNYIANSGKFGIYSSTNKKKSVGSDKGNKVLKSGKLNRSWDKKKTKKKNKKNKKSKKKKSKKAKKKK